MIFPSRATLIGFGVLGILLLAAIGTAKWQHHAAESARAERDALQVQLDTATDANASNLVTINAQANALDQWKRLGMSPDETAVLVANARERERTYNEVLAENKAMKEKDRALPDCIKLLKTSLAVCPHRVIVLRDLEGGYKDGPGGNPGARRRSITTRVDTGLRTEVSLRER